MNWWHYLLLANLYLALFYGFYLLLLRRETYFILNRIYLVSAAILSFFIPMMQSEWVKNLFITQKVQRTIYYIDPGFIYQVSPQADNGFTMAQFFTAVYWLVAMLLLAHLFYRFFKLRQYIRANETGSAFSFFGKISVDENLPQKDVIYQHEMIHAAHLHSADVLLFEVLTILNWFNPVIYFYRKSIKHNHEFIADRNAINFGVDRSDYALLLLSQTMNVQPNTLTNSFFNQSLLKQRIMMLHKNPSRRSALLKYGLSAPLFVLMLIFTSATVSEQKTIRTISDQIISDTPISTVVKDIDSKINSLPKPPFSSTVFIKTESELKGKVVNVQGKPLTDVKVSYDKKKLNTVTDADGDFSFPDYIEGDPLTFKYTDKYAESATITAFNNTKGKLQIVVFPDRRPTMANSIVADKHPSKNDVISFAAVEMLPSFIGGEKAFGNFLASHIRYPKVAKENNTQGRVIVSFIVEKNGSLTNIKVLRDIGGGAGPEAVRVLAESPKWNPGIQNGKKVRVSYTMPVNFTLAGDNKSVDASSSAKTNDNDIVNFTAVENLPSFPGGEKAFGMYLAKTIIYPKIARNNKTQGRVIVTFIVEKTGNLSNIKVLRDIGDGCGAEAVRVLSHSPKWNPGIQNGKKVRVAYTMPVNFTLDDGNDLNKGKVKFMSEDSVIKHARALRLGGEGTMTIGGFGGKDSARQRPPADAIRIQTKIMNIDPIYMIDGKEVDKDILITTKPSDIESISVLKGKSATDRYGDKGKNGIVEITMKKSKKP